MHQCETGRHHHGGRKVIGEQQGIIPARWGAHPAVRAAAGEGGNQAIVSGLHRGMQSMQSILDTGADLVAGAERFACRRQFRRHLLGFDRVLCVLGLCTTFPVGAREPFVEKAALLGLDTQIQRQLLGVGAPQQQPLHQCLDHRTVLSGTGTDTPVALRICSCLRSSTSSTMPSILLSRPYSVTART